MTGFGSLHWHTSFLLKYIGTLHLDGDINTNGPHHHIQFNALRLFKHHIYLGHRWYQMKAASFSLQSYSYHFRCDISGMAEREKSPKVIPSFALDVLDNVETRVP